MKQGQIFIGIKVICLLMLFAFALPGAGPALSADFSEVEKILGVSGQTQEGVTVFGFPRLDLQIRIGDDSVPTAIGFGSWTGWKEIGGEAMVMGDLVLLQKEINPVISALAEANVSVTALHNHFLGENPRCDASSPSCTIVCQSLFCLARSAFSKK